jgi:hypothetical protein
MSETSASLDTTSDSADRSPLAFFDTCLGSMDRLRLFFHDPPPAIAFPADAPAEGRPRRTIDRVWFELFIQHPSILSESTGFV